MARPYYLSNMLSEAFRDGLADEVHDLLLDTGDDLIVELTALCYRDDEIEAVQDDRLRLLLSSASVSREDSLKVRTLLVKQFRDCAPREIFPGLSGKVGDSGREAIILANFLGGRLDRYWGRMRAGALVADRGEDGTYGVFDENLSTSAVAARRLLATPKVDSLNRRYLTLRLVVHPSPQIADASGTALSEVEVDAAAVDFLKGTLSTASGRGLKKLVAWAGAEAYRNPDARRLLMLLLSPEFGDIRRIAAEKLVPLLQADEMTPNLVALAFEDGFAVSRQIREKVPAEIIEAAANERFIPMLLNRDLPEVQARSLAGRIGSDEKLTAAFTDLLADIDRELESDGGRRSHSFDWALSALANPSARLPPTMWSTISTMIGRCEKAYSYSSGLGKLVYAQSSDPSAHALCLNILPATEESHDLCRAFVNLSSKSPLFLSGLLERLRHSDPKETGTLASYLAAEVADEETQAVLAELLLLAAKTGYGWLVTEILHGFTRTNWTPPVVKAFEEIAEKELAPDDVIRGVLSSRLPGTAEAMPRGRGSLKRIMAFPDKGSSSPLPALSGLLTEIRTGKSLSSLSSFWDDLDVPEPLTRSRFPDPERFFVWLGDYVFDPHPEFWKHMPPDVVRVDLERSAPGRERVRVGFSNRTSLELALSELLDADFTPPGLTESDLDRMQWPRARRNPRGGNNPHSKSMSVPQMLSLLRGNIALLCRPSAVASADHFSHTIRRSETLARTDGGGKQKRGMSANGNVWQVHPLRFIEAYRTGPLADAYDRNALSVIKRSPAERLLADGAAGLGSAEMAEMKKRLMLLEAASIEWVKAGAKIILSSKDRPDAAAAQGDIPDVPETFGFVALTGSNIVNPSSGRKIEGFYFGHRNGRKNSEYVVIFVHRSIGKCPTFLEVAEDLSEICVCHIPASASLEDAVASACRDALKLSWPAPPEAIRLAGEAIMRSLTGSERTMGARDRGYISIPYGRSGREDWADKFVRFSTFFDNEEGRGFLAKRPEKKRSTRPDLTKLDLEPAESDGRMTHYLIEEEPGIWKRIKRGDLVGRNGNAVYPQFADSTRKVVVASVFLKGAKAVAIGSLQRGFFHFDHRGSMQDAHTKFCQKEFMQLERELGISDETTTPQSWTLAAADLKAIRENILYGQRATLLKPVYG